MNREVERLSQVIQRLTVDRDSWRRAKRESDVIITNIVKLVPHDVEGGDIFAAIDRIIRERDEAKTEIIDLRQSVESFLQLFGSWVEPNGTRHCNDVHTGHSLCKALD